MIQHLRFAFPFNPAKHMHILPCFVSWGNQEAISLQKQWEQPTPHIKGTQEQVERILTGQNRNSVNNIK